LTDNIFDKIEEEHDELEEMIDTLIETGKQDDNFKEFKTELIAHLEAEEQSLFEELKKETEAKELALVAIEEHHIAEEVLDKLENKQGDDFKVQLNVMKHLLKIHHEVEETEIIPTAKKLLSTSTVDKLSEQFESIEEKLESQTEAVSTH
jgi:hemerythrin-like domain-containing protein